MPETYWEIQVSYREPGGKHCDFRYHRPTPPYHALSCSTIARALLLSLYPHSHFFAAVHLEACWVSACDCCWVIASQRAAPLWCRWSRGRLFDHAVATMLYEPCVADPMATVLKASQESPTASAERRSAYFLGPTCLP